MSNKMFEKLRLKIVFFSWISKMSTLLIQNFPKHLECDADVQNEILKKPLYTRDELKHFYSFSFDSLKTYDVNLLKNQTKSRKKKIS